MILVDDIYFKIVVEMPGGSIDKCDYPTFQEACNNARRIRSLNPLARIIVETIGYKQGIVTVLAITRIS